MSIIQKFSIPVWLMNIFFITIPMVLDELFVVDFIEFSWFSFIIPTLFFSYSFGLRGGVLFAIFATVLHLGWEIAEYKETHVYSMSRLYVFLTVTCVNFINSVGIGLLVNKLNKQKDVLETLNHSLEKVASTDGLTGLYNRRAFMLKAQSHTKTSNAILLLDLDGFKQVNDTFGHDIGDLLLQEISYQIVINTSDEAIIARLGGDEFIILLPNSDYQQTTLVAKQLIFKISNIKQIKEKAISISTSIGISYYPNDSNNIEQVVKYADIALYKVKKTNKNNFHFYDKKADLP